MQDKIISIQFNSHNTKLIMIGFEERDNFVLELNCQYIISAQVLVCSDKYIITASINAPMGIYYTTKLTSKSPVSKRVAKSSAW